MSSVSTCDQVGTAARADDVVAGFRFAAGIQLQIDLDIRHGDLPPGRDHLQRDGRAGTETGQDQSIRRRRRVATADFRRFVGAPGMTEIVGEGNEVRCVFQFCFDTRAI